MADKDADKYQKIESKYGPGLAAIKKTYIHLVLENDQTDDMIDVLADDLGAYERFWRVQSAWGFFEALLSIPEPAALEIIAKANEK
jgi:hypothetical protein